MTSPLLQVRNLDVSFPHNNGRVAALNNISFHLNRGEVFALVGESGSGKSLSAHSILRLLPSTASIDRGEILFHPEGQGSVNIADADKHTIRRIRGNRIAMIFQEP